MSHEHLDDDALSTLLDGAGEATIDGCETCRARLDALRRASELLAVAPADPDPARRETAIAAALAEAHGIGLGGVSPANEVGDLAAARARRRGVGAPAAGWLGAAAALVLVFALVGTLTGTDDDTGTDQVAVQPDDSAETFSDDAASGALGAPEVGELRRGPFDLGDLGAFSEQSGLAGALAPYTARGGDGADASAPAPAEGGTGSGAGGSADSSPVDEATAQCQDRHLRDFPSAGPALLTARATFQDRPVVVLVHELAEPDDEGHATGVWVMAADTCDLVAFFGL